MRFRTAPISHLSYLIEWVLKTEGPVLELGIGIGSTPVLHELCRNRQLVSYENDLAIFNKFFDFHRNWHELNYVETYAQAPIERPWSVAFVDISPTLERRLLMMRLKPWADYILVHDTELTSDRHYHVRELFRKFKYAKSYKSFKPHTTVLSDKYPV